jgi:RNA polymerase sigma factor (sigma-70 family)
MKNLSSQHETSSRRIVEAAQSKFERQLIRYAQHFVAREELAAEIVQETFLKLFQQKNLPDESELGAWLFRVCRNRAIDIQRRERRMKSDSTTLLESAMTGSSDPATIISHHETVQQLNLALAGLTENQQEVIRLKFQSGFSYKEIAEVTGLSVSNVGVQLHEAIQKIRACLKPYQ